MDELPGRLIQLYLPILGHFCAGWYRMRRLPRRVRQQSRRHLRNSLRTLTTPHHAVLVEQSERIAEAGEVDASMALASQVRSQTA